jgi:acyl-coenzyme A synthetase/AMP-(fatty) acid ligase
MRKVKSIAHAIAWHARRTPQAIAVVRQGGPVTYRRLARDVTRCGYALSDFNIGPGMLVGLSLSHRYTHLLLMLGCELAGATMTAVLTDDDDIIQHCDIVLTDQSGPLTQLPKTTLLTPDWLARARPPRVSPPRVSPSLGDAPDPLEREIPPEQIVRLLRTSGTTGRPKSMPLPHATWMLRVDRTIGPAADVVLPLPRLLCPYPLTIVSADMRVMGTLYHGGTVYLAAQDDVAGLIASGVINWAVLSLGDADGTAQRGIAPPAGHRMFIDVVGASVSLPLRQRLRGQLNAVMLNKYGANELHSIATFDDDNVGTLEPGTEARIVDESGNEVFPGQTGRIRIRNDVMVHCYFNDPDLTAACFIDGWFQTNDLGSQPAPGKLLLHGRVDEVLNIGGVKVPTAPIEHRIRQIDGVSDAVLVSINNSRNVGILLVAVETATLEMAELEEKISPVLALHRITYSLMLSRSLPRTRTGKVMRHAIEAEFRDSLTDDQR